MSSANELARMLENQKTMFTKSTSLLGEADSRFAPGEGVFTVAQHVAHVAQSLDWFIEGAFEREGGPDSDFQAALREVQKVDSLAKAREWLDRSFARAVEVIGSKSDAELDAPFAGEILGDFPKRALVAMNADHAAHHRGALTVYTRLLGKEPPMPYM